MNKVLVAYFSASQTTQAVAEKLKDEIQADVFEIVPENLYTKADLDWQNSKSRSSLEMSDSTSRPRIKNNLTNMEQYEIVFIGFPIWWYREPSIVDTFLEAYDFTGKTIIPFATSGGSGMGKTSEGIAQLVPMAKVEEGRVFSSREMVENLKRWAISWL